MRTPPKSIPDFLPASGIRVDTPVAHYFKFDSAGKVSRYQNFANSGAFVAAMHATPVGTH